MPSWVIIEGTWNTEFNYLSISQAADVTPVSISKVFMTLNQTLYHEITSLVLLPLPSTIPSPFDKRLLSIHHYSSQKDLKTKDESKARIFQRTLFLASRPLFTWQEQQRRGRGSCRADRTAGLPRPVWGHFPTQWNDIKGQFARESFSQL